ncbi:BatD family protein [Thiobacillus sp.]
MVRVLMLLLMAGAAHAASLTARLDRTVVALGEPVNLTVRARGLNLDALDPAPLGATFDVYARTRSSGESGETLVLTLYPRAAGVLRIPALPLGHMHTQRLSLKVTDGNEAVPRVTADWTLEPAMLRVNQPTRLTLSICDDGSLQWQRPDLPTQTGRSVRVLGEEEHAGVHMGGEVCTLHRYFWALLATRAGPATLGVPMLDANRFGQRLRFPGPDLAYQAVALPAWLPDHVPPVAPVIHADPLPERWPMQRPFSWRFEVLGGYSAAGLRALLDGQLRDSPALGIYPPLIEAVAPDDPASPLSRYVVTLFLEPRASGALNLPALRLPWYDAARGQMASMRLAGKTLTVFDPRRQRIVQGMLGLAGALLLAGAIWQIRCRVRWRLARRRGLRAIREARDIAGLDQAVRQFSLTGEASASSLGAWQHRVQREMEACDVADAVRRLERQRFGQDAPTLAALQQGFLGILARSRPKSRSFRSLLCMGVRISQT